MNNLSRRCCFQLAVALLLIGPGLVRADHKPASSIPESALIQPAALAAQAQQASAPLILQVGSKALFDQGHIVHSQYAGPAGQPEGLTLLRAKVAKLPKDAAIVLYCGCCPWSRCPNIAAAYDELQALKFTHVNVLYIAENFGADWADKGYPVGSGE